MGSAGDHPRVKQHLDDGATLSATRLLDSSQPRPQDLSLTIEYPFDPTKLTQGWWFRRWWPSRRVGIDPQRHVLIEGRYAPVSIANWKLIAPVARGLIAQRHSIPLTFAANRRLTVVIPFRDRQAHLEQLLPRLGATLRDQCLDYTILVVEQLNEGAFNRGKLLNAGVHFAKDRSDYYCLHDVDTIPVRANYLCPSQPLRLVHTITGPQGGSFRQDYYFSGAVSIRKEQMFAANGYSNEYWGWGKEDDDLFFRLLMAGFFCYFDLCGEYEDLPNPHHQQVPQSKAAKRRQVSLNRGRRSRLQRGLEQPAFDGLSTLQYELVRHSNEAGFEKISVRW